MRNSPCSQAARGRGDSRIFQTRPTGIRPDLRLLLQNHSAMRRGSDFGRQYGLSVLTGFGPKVSRSGTCFGIAAESGICGNGLQESQRWNRGPALGSCEDLFFRLSVFPIHIPPLRERISDVRLLAQFFVEKFSKDLHRQSLQLSPEAAGALEQYSWPGNVRELQNTIERAVILSDGNTIRTEDLNFAFYDRKRSEDFVHFLDLSGSLSDVSNRAACVAEKAKIRQVLDLSNWNKPKRRRS